MKDKKRLLALAIVGVILVSCLMCCGIATLISSSSTPEEPSNQPQSPTVTETPNQGTATPSLDPTATPEPTKVETSEDRINKAIENSIKSKGYTMQFDSSSGLVTLTKESMTYWDDNTLVSQGYGSLVEFGLEGFKLDEVKTVKVVIMAEFKDSYGQSSTQEAMRIQMQKEEFQKYNWGELRYSSIYNQMDRSLVENYIHPGVFNNVDTSKVKLSY